MYEYDYCKQVYEAMGEFRDYRVAKADGLQPLAEQIALTYAYRNNAEDPEKMAEDTASAILSPLLNTYLESLSSRNQGFPKPKFLGACMEALR